MEAKKDTGKVNTLISLTESLLWWNEEEGPKALTPMEEAIKLAKELSFPKGLAKSLDLKGQYYLNHYNKEQALKYFYEALAVRKQINDKQGMVISYMNIAYTGTEKYDERMKLYLEALKLAKETGDNKLIGGIYESLGLLSFEEAFYRQALKYYTEYFKIAQEVQDHDMLFTAHNQLGLINIQMGYYNEALSHFFSAEKVRKYASNWANIALVYELQGNYPEALKFYYSALEKNFEKGDKQRIIRNKSSIGSIYLTESAELLKKGRNIDTVGKKLALAKNFLLPSVEFYQQNSDKGGLAGAYLSLGEYYKVEAKFMSSKKERIDSVQKTLAQAENSYLTTLKIYEELQDWYSIHSGKPQSMKELGSFYKTQAEIFQNYNLTK
jgi:tetratricopeptide (TPR) repeat protein